jgi:hypothetical protein
MPSYLRKDKNHKGNWVRSLLALGQKPEVVVIQELADKAILAEAETFWIAYFKAMGCSLTNHQRGGAGFTGEHSEETKRKMSASRRGKQLGNQNCLGRVLADETRAKISAAMRGNKNAVGRKTSQRRRD